MFFFIFRLLLLFIGAFAFYAIGASIYRQRMAKKEKNSKEEAVEEDQWSEF